MEVTAVAATGTVNERGPLATLISEYGQAQGRARVDGKVSPEAWAEVSKFVDTDRFLRVDTDLSEMDWAAYTALLTGGPLGKGQPVSSAV